MELSQPGFNVLRLLLLLIPVLLIQVGLAAFALIDFAKRKAVRGPRGLWLGLLIVSIFSFPAGVVISGLYLAWGRNAEADNDTD